MLTFCKGNTWQWNDPGRDETSLIGNKAWFDDGHFQLYAWTVLTHYQTHYAKPYLSTFYDFLNHLLVDINLAPICKIDLSFSIFITVYCIESQNIVWVPYITLYVSEIKKGCYPMLLHLNRFSAIYSPEITCDLYKLQQLNSTPWRHAWHWEISVPDH